MSNDLGPPPPGWYPDPWQTNGLRWWDGGDWTGHAAAAGPSATLRLDEQERSGGRAKVAVLAVIPLLLVGQAAVVALMRFIVDHADDEAVSPFAEGFGARQALAQVGSLGNVVAGILFLLWFYRACVDARALGLPARRDPGLATGSFVIPIVNLWWPYQSTCDLLPHDHPARRNVLRWWLLWVVGGPVSSIVVVIGALISPAVGYAMLVVPAVQLVLAALAARQVVSDVLDTHRELARVAGQI